MAIPWLEHGSVQQYDDGEGLSGRDIPVEDGKSKVGVNLYYGPLYL